jgi:DNA uptake protein ComE-like DNA-binding protein
MNRSTFKPALLAVALLLAGGQALATDDVPNNGAAAPAKPHKKPHVRPVNNVKQVDINAASKAELMVLPGIHAAEADRIIAGRPYGSKAWLVSKKILPEGAYQGISAQIIALQHVPIVAKPAPAAGAHK